MKRDPMAYLQSDPVSSTSGFHGRFYVNGAYFDDYAAPRSRDPFDDYVPPPPRQPPPFRAARQDAPPPESSQRDRDEPWGRRARSGFAAASDLAVLGLPSGSDHGPEKIKAAYRRRVFELHPDRGGNEAEFKRLRPVYERLMRAHGETP